MSFKTFDLSHDVASIVSSINEVVAVSSSIYAEDLNVKFFKNISSGSSAADLGGYFQTVYDSSPTASYSTALFDMTYGYSTGSAFNVLASAYSSQNEKVKIYRQMASVLLGDPDAVFNISSFDQPECFFIMIKRNVQKDEIKKGATSLIINGNTQYVISDEGAANSFNQTVGGDYAPLKNDAGAEMGQIWYNAGVIVLSDDMTWDLPGDFVWSGSLNLDEVQQSGSINDAVNGLRTHIDRIDFHNQTNLYSTVYFCRATNTEFNYSSNPTFVDDNKRIRVTSGSNILQTRTYATTVGLYDTNDNLLAVAKINKPITKSPDTEATFRIRLDY